MALINQYTQYTSTIKDQDNGQISIMIATKEHREGILRLEREQFLPREPIEASLGTTWEEAEESLTCEVDEAISQPCSFVAVHPQHGVIGFRTTKFMQLHPNYISDPNDLLVVKGDAPTLYAFQQIILQLMSGWEQELIQHGHQSVFQFVSLCVDQQFANQGLAKRMIEESTKLAERLHVDCIFAIATNKISQHVLQKAGFSVWRSLNYADAKNPETGKPWVIPNGGNKCIQWVVKIMKRKGPSG